MPTPLQVVKRIRERLESVTRMELATPQMVQELLADAREVEKLLDPGAPVKAQHPPAPSALGAAVRVPTHAKLPPSTD